MAFVEVRGLKKHYGEEGSRIQVLRGIDVSLEKGEICVLLGPSGSGKSTFLNIIGGLENADAGSITVEGSEILQLSSRDLGEYRRRELGFVFQFYNLVPDLTVRENIEVCAHLSNDPLDLEELLDALGIADQAEKFPRQISGGQQQRCAIGRALVKNPRLLLCDEPTGALDYQTSKEILALMESVNQRFGCTMLIVTHNDAIGSMANRVLRLRDGIISENIVNEVQVHASLLEW